MAIDSDNPARIARASMQTHRSTKYTHTEQINTQWHPEVGTAREKIPELADPMPLTGAGPNSED